MDLLAKKRMLPFLMLTGMAGTAWADELFRLSVVDYFGMKGRASGKERESFVWTEPGYSPPQVVADLLDDPNEQTARRYLEWHRARLLRLAAAQRMIGFVEGASLTKDEP